MAEQRPPAFSASSMSGTQPVNPLLQRERETGSVRPTALAHMLCGGAAAFTRMQALNQIMQSDPVFDTTDRPFLNHTERYLRSAQKMAAFHAKVATASAYNILQLHYYTLPMTSVLTAIKCERGSYKVEAV
jgi:Acyl-coenzyme A oxidase N-terminal